jgi:hypothetical protein
VPTEDADTGLTDLHVMVVPPELYTRVHAASVAAGETVPEWVSRALRERLARSGDTAANGHRQLLTEVQGR